MKKIPLLLILFSILFVACKDDDPTSEEEMMEEMMEEEEMEEEPNIVGIWNVDKIEITVDQDTSDGSGSGTMTFNADLTGKKDYSFNDYFGNPFSVIADFTYEVDNDDNIKITLPNGGVESWTRIVNTETDQELVVNLNINTIVTEMKFFLSQ